MRLQNGIKDDFSVYELSNWVNGLPRNERCCREEGSGWLVFTVGDGDGDRGLPLSILTSLTSGVGLTALGFPPCASRRPQHCVPRFSLSFCGHFPTCLPSECRWLPEWFWSLSHACDFP